MSRLPRVWNLCTQPDGIEDGRAHDVRVPIASGRPLRRMQRTHCASGESVHRLLRPSMLIWAAHPFRRSGRLGPPAPYRTGGIL